MSTYIIYCRDKPDSHAKRQAALQAHFRYIEKILDDILVAGPVKNQQGDIVGSLYIVQSESEQDARALLEADPYFAADIWSSIDIHRYTAAAGAWVGGKIWASDS